MSGGRGFWAGVVAGLILSLAVVSGVSALVFISLKGNGWKLGSSAANAPRAAAPVASESNIPVRGAANAPVTIMEFADFHCVYCKKAAETVAKIVAEYPGQVKSTFRHFPLTSTPGEGSFLTHEAAACAHAQGKFWEYHDAVYRWPGFPKPGDLREIGRQAGLEMPRFETCLKERRYQKFIASEAADGASLGVQGTPTFFINGQRFAGALPYEEFKKNVEAVLHPSANALGPEGRPELDVPGAGPVKFDGLAGRPSEGPENAPVQLVEFTDFHCPYCKALQPTLTELKKKYPDKIRHVWQHFPLSFHAGAERLHEASECAAEQGKFWAFREKAFEGPGGAHPDDELAKLAEASGLDVSKFSECLKSGRGAEAVQKDKARGEAAGVTGTPAVFINGEKIVGARPLADFEAAVQKAQSNPPQN